MAQTLLLCSSNSSKVKGGQHLNDGFAAMQQQQQQGEGWPAPK
jgi:hypothetical protein